MKWKSNAYLDSIVARVADVDVAFDVDGNAFGWAEMARWRPFDTDLTFVDALFVKDLNTIEPLVYRVNKKINQTKYKNKEMKKKGGEEEESTTTQKYVIH